MNIQVGTPHYCQHSRVTAHQLQPITSLNYRCGTAAVLPCTATMAAPPVLHTL
jgi:hypothetical protein